MSALPRSVSVIDSGGVKVTCFKYRQCHDNMPRSTYEAICITLLPVGETGGARHVPPFVSARSNAE